MIAAFATLAFLSTLWMLAVVGMQVLEESGGRILAALRGHSPLAYSPKFVPVSGRLSARSRYPRPVRAEPRWRAAA